MRKLTYLELLNLSIIFDSQINETDEKNKFTNVITRKCRHDIGNRCYRQHQKVI